MLGHVLVVDDEPDVQLLVRLFLEPEGAVVETAASGEEALERIAATLFDLVLLDLGLPGMGGQEVLRILRDDGRLERLPVLVVSAHAGAATTTDVLAFGCRAYLSKPFTRLELLAAVAEATA